MTVTAAAPREVLEVDAAGPADIWHLSASSVVKALAAPQLEAWKINETAERVCLPEQLAELTTLVNRGQTSAAVSIVKGIRFEGKDDRLSAADRGTECHAYLEARLLGHPTKAYSDHVAAQLYPYFTRIEDWLSRWQPVPVMVEATVYNPEHGVGGRLDLVVDIPEWHRMQAPNGDRLTGSRQLVDTKTAESGFNRWGKPTRPYGTEHAIQLSIYRHATLVANGHVPRLLPRDGVRFYLLNDQERASCAPMPPVDGALILHVAPEHAHAHPVLTDEHVYRFALNIRQAWLWINEVSKTVVGDVLAPTVAAP